MDIKIKPAMDSPKVKNHEFVPKEAGRLWREHHEQQETQRGPKERVGTAQTKPTGRSIPIKRRGGDERPATPSAVKEAANQPKKKGDEVRYATDRVETAGKYAAAYAGSKTVQALRGKQSGNKPLKDAAIKTAENKPKEQDDGVRYATDQVETTAKNTAVYAGREAAQALHGKKNREKGSAESRQPTPQERGRENAVRDAAQRNVAEKYPAPRQPTPQERGREKAVRDAVTAKREAQSVLREEQAVSKELTVSAIKTRQQEMASKPSNAVKTANAAQQRKKKTGIPSPQARMRRSFAAKQRSAIVSRNAQILLQRVTEAAKALARTVKAAVTGVSALIGGGVALAVLPLLLLVIVGALAASPFGILFANEPNGTDTVPLSAAISQINFEFNQKLNDLKEDGDRRYDGGAVILNTETADWVDVLTIFAVKTASGTDAVDVATMDADRVARLKKVFMDMNEIDLELETEEVSEDLTITTLYISVIPKTAEDMKREYGFTAKQCEMVDELLSQRALLEDLIADLTHSSAEVAEILSALPEDLSPERRAVVETACSLVGKVTYFWGGKSLKIGWDSRWGSPKRVTAAGSSTTGDLLPYGLDCSGFVDWVFFNASNKAYYPGHGGGAIMQHNDCTSIMWSQAQPGDLVFYPDDSHVGIVVGHDASGLRIVHCSFGYNNVVITGLEGFSSVGRPSYFH